MPLDNVLRRVCFPRISPLPDGISPITDPLSISIASPVLIALAHIPMSHELYSPHRFSAETCRCGGGEDKHSFQQHSQHAACCVWLVLMAYGMAHCYISVPETAMFLGLRF